MLARGVIFLLFFCCVSSAVHSAVGNVQLERKVWSFAGPFGRFDKAQLQRGFKVFEELCATCHSAKFLSFRALTDYGGPEFTEAQVKKIAAKYQIVDGPDDSGETFLRAGRISDMFPSPYPNDEFARAANGGAVPPDLSLIAKAVSISPGFPGFVIDLFTLYREYGVDYIYGFLTRYVDESPVSPCSGGQVYNEVFGGGSCVSMPRPSFDDLVVCKDDASADIEAHVKDVTSFLMWLAEPKLQARKQMGFKVIVFLLFFAAILYLLKVRVWSKVG